MLMLCESDNNGMRSVSLGPLLSLITKVEPQMTQRQAEKTLVSITQEKESLLGLWTWGFPSTALSPGTGVTFMHGAANLDMGTAHLSGTWHSLHSLKLFSGALAATTNSLDAPSPTIHLSTIHPCTYSFTHPLSITCLLFIHSPSISQSSIYRSPSICLFIHQPNYHSCSLYFLPIHSLIHPLISLSIYLSIYHSTISYYPLI